MFTNKNKRSDWLTGLLDCEKLIFNIGVPETVEYYYREVSWAFIGDSTQYQNGWEDALHHHRLYILKEK